jgi:hypothetical protein
MEYALAFLLILGVNLLPAFGPPTWAVLVLCVFNFDLEPLVLVPTGAIAAASGRFLLATGARRFRSRLRRERIASLAAARDFLVHSRARAGAALGLYALSPVPSAQLFIAAGLLAAPLVPLTLAFFGGRLISYSMYVGAATAANEGLGSILEDSLTSPVGVALQLAMLGGLVALLRIDWAAVIVRGGYGPKSRLGPDGSAPSAS